MEKEFDCLIIGGGPSGLSASLYLKRLGINCAIIDKTTLGGTPINYLEIENYLGFNKINGFELCEKFENHVDCFNVEKFPFEEIQNIDLNKKEVTTLENKFKAKAIILAMGAENKKLGIKGELENIGRGVSYCAICDGHFYKDKIVSVIGGGNSALEEAIYLSNLAKKVYLIHRRNEFRADKIIQDKLKNYKNIEVIFDTIPLEIMATTKVEALKIKNVKNDKEDTLKVDGIFPYIGLKANSNLVSNQLKLDKQGFIETNQFMETSIDGVFAIGDIRTTPLRQVITAVSDGAIAANQATKYIERIKQNSYEGINL